MNGEVEFATIANWIIITGSILLLSVILAGWLASYRFAKTPPVTSGDWFFVLPVWAQIAGGITTCILLAYLGYILWIPLPLTVPPALSGALLVAGLALFLVGWVLVMMSRRALGTLYGVSTSFAAPLQTQHRLVQHGPYTFIRHPMYLGYWLLLAGVTLVYLTLTPLVFLTLMLRLYRRAQREESALAAAFGAEWEAHVARTQKVHPRSLVTGGREEEFEMSIQTETLISFSPRGRCSCCLTPSTAM